MHILHTVLYKFRNVLKRRIFKNRELFYFELISSILLTLMFDLRVILWGEIRCQSLLGVEALKGKKFWLPCYHSPSQICFLALRLPFHASLLIHLVVYEWHWFFRSENPEPSDVRLQVAIKRRRKKMYQHSRRSYLLLMWLWRWLPPSTQVSKTAITFPDKIPFHDSSHPSDHNIWLFAFLREIDSDILHT